jgi:hypothetical protein
MPNNPDLVPTSLNLFPQRLIVAIGNILPTIDALAFVNTIGEFFWVLELEFLVKGFEIFFVTRHIFSTEGWNLQNVIYEASQAQRGYLEHHEPKSYPSVSSFIGRYFDTPCVGFATGFLHNLETCTLCWMCTTFLKSWNWLKHTMKPILWGFHHV